MTGVQATRVRTNRNPWRWARLIVLAGVLLNPQPAPAAEILDFAIDEGSLSEGGNVLFVDGIAVFFEAQFSRTGDAFDIAGTYLGIDLLRNEATEVVSETLLGVGYTLNGTFSGAGTVSGTDLVFSSMTFNLLGDPTGATPPVPLLTSSNGGAFGTPAGFLTMKFYPFDVLYPAYFLSVPDGSALIFSVDFPSFAPDGSVDFRGAGNVTFQPVPEPTMFLLVGSGLAAFQVARFRRRRHR